ncbi:hypothetical protein BVX98_07985 [bacterium F11]|nr:hypothetical protein BVX98_07985 [bacterium F11]
MKKDSLSSLYKTVKEALLIGGNILKKGFRSKRHISYKTPISPVTQVDKESERRIVSLIRKRFPHHVFLAEESAFLEKGDISLSDPNRTRWVIDPLDGTTNYIHYIPQACVSVAVEVKGVTLAGGVYDPFREELFMAAKGKGATCNGKKIRVSQKKKMIESLLITGFPYDRDVRSNYYLGLLKPFLKKTMGIRRFGSAALDLAWVACGRAEGYWECNLHPWDVAAGDLLVREAGGMVTDFQGRPYKIDHPLQTLASNSRIHPQLIAMMKKGG